jgi:hypothetical protein
MLGSVDLGRSANTQSMTESPLWSTMGDRLGEEESAPRPVPEREEASMGWPLLLVGPIAGPADQPSLLFG